MLPVSAAELALIQSDTVTAVCDKVCVIKRATKTPDGFGSESEALVTISPDDLMAGMAQPTAGQLQNYDFLIGSLSAWQVHLPVGTDVQTQDTILIDGQTLTVQVVLDPQSYQALRTVLASEVKQQ